MKELKDRIRAEVAFAIYALQEGRELDAYGHLGVIDDLCSEIVDMDMEAYRQLQEAALKPETIEYP